MKLTIKDITLLFFALITVILTIILLTKDDTRENELKAEIKHLKAIHLLYQDSIKIIDRRRAEAYREIIIIGNKAEELEAQLQLNKLNNFKKKLENEKSKSIIIPDSTTIDSIFTSILQGR